MDSQDSQQRRLVAEAIRSVDLTQTEGWATLLQLSPRPNVESVETFEDEIQLKQGMFVGALLWHVTLQFDDSGQSIITSESLPGRFEGRFDGGIAAVDRITVDTSAVFE